MGQRHYGNITGVKKCNEGENSKRGSEGRRKAAKGERERDVRGTTCRIWGKEREKWKSWKRNSVMAEFCCGDLSVCCTSDIRLHPMMLCELLHCLISMFEWTPTETQRARNSQKLRNISPAKSKDWCRCSIKFIYQSVLRYIDSSSLIPVWSVASEAFIQNTQQETCQRCRRRHVKYHRILTELQPRFTEMNEMLFHVVGIISSLRL